MGGDKESLPSQKKKRIINWLHRLRSIKNALTKWFGLILAYAPFKNFNNNGESIYDRDKIWLTTVLYHKTNSWRILLHKNCFELYCKRTCYNSSLKKGKLLFYSQHDMEVVHFWTDIKSSLKNAFGFPVFLKWIDNKICIMCIWYNLSVLSRVGIYLTVLVLCQGSFN